MDYFNNGHPERLARPVDLAFGRLTELTDDCHLLVDHCHTWGTGVDAHWRGFSQVICI